MKELTITELKDIQLEIMKDIHDFCVAHNLSYYLAYGTLIGAIRHFGYIPWDDDIDIFMPRPDYEKFVKIYNTRYDSIYQVISPEINSNYYASYANVYDTRTYLEEEGKNHRISNIGVKIDIFPLDGVSNSIFLCKIQKTICRICSSFMREKNTNFSQAMRNGTKRVLVNGLVKIGGVLIPYTLIHRTLLWVAKWNDYNSCDYVDNVVTGIYENRKSKSLFGNPKLWNFEKYAFYIPIGYDKYLTDRYGDYTKMPPKNQQVPHHGFRAFWK